MFLVLFLRSCLLPSLTLRFFVLIINPCLLFWRAKPHIVFVTRNKNTAGIVGFDLWHKLSTSILWSVYTPSCSPFRLEHKILSPVFTHRCFADFRASFLRANYEESFLSIFVHSISSMTSFSKTPALPLQIRSRAWAAHP